jgi:hypothetical protein
MRLLLAAAAVVELATGVLVGLAASAAGSSTDWVGLGSELSPLGTAFGYRLAGASLGLGLLFGIACTNPLRHLGAISAGLALLAVRVVAALIEVLGLLPGTVALFSLADLVVSVALFVGILEALPTLRGLNRARSR